MAEEPEYVQLKSWAELIEWLEKYRDAPDPTPEWNPKPKRKSKKRPPQSEGLF